MSVDKVQQVIELVRAHPDQCNFMDPRSEDLIHAAEAALRFRLPPSYRQFVSELGALGVGSEDICGVTSNNFTSGSSPNAIWLTLDERETSDLPPTMVIIYEDGMGGYFILDTAKAPPGGEPPVEVWEAGASQLGDRLEFIASDFGTWLLDTVRAELNLD
jgi:hypothetical protein